MKILPFALASFALLCLLVVSCKQKKPQSDLAQFKLDEPFELAYLKTAKLEGVDLVLTFTGVSEDSRCPTGVNCVWAGLVTANLKAVVTNNSSSAGITMEGKPKSPPYMSFEGYKIKLLEVSPYPKDGEKIEAAGYRVKLMVGK